MKDLRINMLARLEAIACERAGMVAENMQRKQLDKSMAYDNDDFSRLTEEALEISQEALDPAI